MSGRMPQAQNYESLQQELLKARALFADPQFPPQVQSIYPSNLTGMNASARYNGQIVWKRPTDLYNNPLYIVKDFKRHDLDQGYLGNCWFVAGAAVLATSHRKEFKRVVPLDQGFQENQYTGMFRFHFWWYGKWTEVIIDDYLPTDGRNLLFCCNKERPNEFWPSLLEKAYAKLYGSYAALDGGKVQDAFVDLTGGISEVINLQEKSEVSPDLFNLLFKSHKMKSMIGSCILRPNNAASTEILKRNGLYMGHAYSITGFHRIPSHFRVIGFQNVQISIGQDSFNLLRIRNPWGRGEWNGRWSDRSPEINQLTPEQRDQLRFVLKDDGEFWMEFDDFVFEFDEIQLCHLQPDALIAELADETDSYDEGKQLWNVTVYHDAWLRGVTAGGCGNAPNERLYWKNPQFFVTLETPDNTLGRGDDCTLIVSLMEKEKKDQAKVAVGFDVYKLKTPQRKPLNDSRAPRDALLLTRRSGTYVFYREVTKRFELQPGTYVIIPSTFYPHEEAEFMIRLFTEKRVDSGILDEQVDPVPTLEPPEDDVTKLFKKYSGKDKLLDAAELCSFIESVSKLELQQPLKFSLEAGRSLVSLMGENKSGFLNLDETKRAWKEIKAYREIFKQFDTDNTDSIDSYELGSLFSKLGFPLSRGVLTSIVQRYGGRNNLISLTDFVMVICKLTYLFAIFHQQQKKAGRSQDAAEFTRNEATMLS